MLEDWLENLEPADDFQKTVMQIVGEENSTELLINFSKEDDQMMTTTLRNLAEEGA
jgi:hypothetical protein